MRRSAMLRTPKDMPNLWRITFVGMDSASNHSFIANYPTIHRLRQKYREFNKRLGQTGAGLQAEEIRRDPNMNNLIGKKLFSN